MAHSVKLDTDVVIVGGGAAGCTLARELSKRGKKVVLVEKGRDDGRLFESSLASVHPAAPPPTMATSVSSLTAQAMAGSPSLSQKPSGVSSLH